MTEQQIQNLIEVNEIQTTEFKKSTGEARQICETICAFANTDGGTILVGINPDRVLSKAEFTDKSQTDITDLFVGFNPAITTFVSIKKVKFGEYFLLLVEIQKSIINYNCYKNDCYQRIGASNKKLTIEEYHQKRLSQNTADWSGQICENATLDDLDLNTIELLKKDIQQYKPSSWDSKYSNKLNPELLTRLGLVINNKITNACILMFGQSEKFENDKRFTGFARIQWQYYPDKDVTKYGKTREQFFIPFYPAIKEIWQKIDSKNDTLANQSLYQSEEKQYEEITIRELLLNSIAHREYANFGMRPFIEIIQTREGITFKNSGKPPFDSIYELEEKK